MFSEMDTVFQYQLIRKLEKFIITEQLNVI